MPDKIVALVDTGPIAGFGRELGHKAAQIQRALNSCL